MPNFLIADQIDFSTTKIVEIVHRTFKRSSLSFLYIASNIYANNCILFDGFTTVIVIKSFCFILDGHGLCMSILFEDGDVAGLCPG